MTTITVATLPSVFRAAYTAQTAPSILARFTDAEAPAFRAGLSFRAAL